MREAFSTLESTGGPAGEHQQQERQGTAASAPAADTAASEPLRQTEHRIASPGCWYALGLLWIVAVLRFVDLQILAVLLESIKAEMSLSDTQLSLLGGLAFALFYGTLGLPVAWLADRYSRKHIIALAVTLWSLMTALCGQAGGFMSLFLARMGVGIGEAGAYPPSTSLLADYFPPARRGRSCAVLASAIPVGVFCGFLIGGVVAENWGWRSAFTLVGLPGILVGVLVLLTLREPPRGAMDSGSPPVREGFRRSVAQLWRSSAYRHLVLAACVFTLGAAGSGIWMPSFFIRHHGLDTAEVGIWMAVLYGGGGLLGSIGGGLLGEKLANHYRDQAWQARLSAWSLLLILPLLPGIFLSADPYTALPLLFLMTTLMHAGTGPVLAQIQHLAGSGCRATAHALSVLVTNVIALPLGPLLIGLSSDHFGPVFGTRTLGLAIMLLLLFSWSWAAWHFLCCARLQNGPEPAGTALTR